MRALLCCAAVLTPCFSALGEDKKETIDVKKLMGKWETEKKEGTTYAIQFTDDGRVTVIVTVDGKESRFEGTYKVDGNRVTVTARADDKEQTMTRTVSTLTDAELVLVNEKGQGRALFVRIKDKK
jgi:uncharacterized protein (TIGR03066 family)